jgi:Ca2+-binding RTX toxin-like protein
MASFVGTSGIDILFGGSDNDIIDGNGGPDFLSGNGDDVLRGGDGSDEYYVELGAGTETIIDSGGAADHIVFGPGISAANISTEIGGNDHVLTAKVGSISTSVIIIGQTTQTAIESVYFSDAERDLSWNGSSFQPSSVRFSDQADVVPGRPTDDYVAVGRGNDVAFGGLGDDVLLGAAGDDLLIGGPGLDRFLGSIGADTLDGGNQDDYLEGGDGNDFIKGAAGDDAGFCDQGDDLIFGGTGNDLVVGDT